MKNFEICLEVFIKKFISKILSFNSLGLDFRPLLRALAIYLFFAGEKFQNSMGFLSQK